MATCQDSSSKKLRVFEAFSGIGAQNSALKRLGINYEIVGTSDWFISAIICYDAIHCSQLAAVELPPYKEQLEYLNNFQFSIDSVKPIKNLKSLKPNELGMLYQAHIRTKNMGSITQISGNTMPETDLLVYSFPCQDLSTGGLSLGMSKGSGTRSCLIWELERILTELNTQDKLPEYLLMENVKAVLADANKTDLELWLDFLKSLGYENDPAMTLDASDFGVPQDRQRTFIVSHLKKKLNVEKRLRKQKKEFEITDFLRLDYNNPVFKTEADSAKLNMTPSREVMWTKNKREPVDNKTMIHTITCNMDRTNTAALFRYENSCRRLTIREAFLLMGFSESEYERTVNLGFSYRRMNKLIGNAIVVNVLTEIFRVMLRKKYMKKGEDECLNNT